MSLQKISRWCRLHHPKQKKISLAGTGSVSCFFLFFVVLSISRFQSKLPVPDLIHGFMLSPTAICLLWSSDKILLLLAWGQLYRFRCRLGEQINFWVLFWKVVGSLQKKEGTSAFIRFPCAWSRRKCWRTPEVSWFIRRSPSWWLTISAGTGCPRWVCLLFLGFWLWNW